MTKLEYFKNEIIKILDRQEQDEINLSKSLEYLEYLNSCNATMGSLEKSYGVGKLSTYADGSVWRKISSNPSKWKMVRPSSNYNTENARTRQAVTVLKKRIRKCKTVDELFEIVSTNFNRFYDTSGSLLPIVEQLVKEVSYRKTFIAKNKQKGITFGDYVQDWIVNLAFQVGIDIKGFRYRFDGDFENHSLNHHGNIGKEKSRGQVAITINGLEIINTVIDKPDFAIVGVKRNGKDNIILIKNDNRGGSILVEEILNGAQNKALNSKTYWITKKKINLKNYKSIFMNNNGYDLSNMKIAARR